MSSSDMAISVRGLSKAYTIVHETRQSTLAETVLQRLRRPLHRPMRETFWALKDVSFEVKRGDVVGIIGRNGAGKSTLLKILSRITEPTDGEVELHGRVGSLLEVGTGFHPELTGRENIFLNGAILGMKRLEIKKQFDAIVDFAGIEQFLDTPVKRYSSGMYVRLAFAVAAHLEPEVLVVDEVLSVGDAEFQQKCVGKMRDVAGSGRTVLFVSHNVGAIRQLCDTGILLDSGSIVSRGTLDEAVSGYLQRLEQRTSSTWHRTAPANGSQLVVQNVSCELLGQQPNHALCVQIRVQSIIDHRPASIAIDISDSSGQVLMQAIPLLEPFIAFSLDAQVYSVRVELPPLVPGRYALAVWVGPHNTETYDWTRECVSFEVMESPSKGRTFPHTPDHGRIVPQSTVSVLEKRLT